ncbi:hypothetical protein GCM10010470_52630 [Saccharopolyspora taberi]|uniref:Uncharacterized protein n=1 Tax=Saccharopolyspora taberi TaxID=60895 RepID=A0ABN3VKV5_9PSEU
MAFGRRLPRGQELLESPVHEVDPALHRRPDNTAALHEKVQALVRRRIDAAHRLELPVDPFHCGLARQFGPAVEVQPERDVLEQHELLPIRQRNFVMRRNSARVLALVEQHLQRRFIKTLAVSRQIPATIQMQCAQHRAHQRTPRQPPEMRTSIEPREQKPLVFLDFFPRKWENTVPGEQRPVPQFDELPHLAGSHVLQVDRRESFAVQPLRTGRSRARGDDDARLRVALEQLPQPASDLRALPVPELVDPVHQQQRPARRQLPVRPALRKRSERGAAGPGHELLGLGQGLTGVAAELDQDRDTAVPLLQIAVEVPARRAHRQPAQQRGLARPGLAAHERQVRRTQRLLDAQRSGQGVGVLVFEPLGEEVVLARRVLVHRQAQVGDGELGARPEVVDVDADELQVVEIIGDRFQVAPPELLVVVGAGRGVEAGQRHPREQPLDTGKHLRRAAQRPLRQPRLVLGKLADQVDQLHAAQVERPVEQRPPGFAQSRTAGRRRHPAPHLPRQQHGIEVAAQQRCVRQVRLVEGVHDRLQRRDALAIFDAFPRAQLFELLADQLADLVEPAVQIIPVPLPQAAEPQRDQFGQIRTPADPGLPSGRQFAASCRTTALPAPKPALSNPVNASPSALNRSSRNPRPADKV